jgi:MFS transporter, DHA1 family, multidrug resistance protein
VLAENGRKERNYFLIILILGVLSTLSPLSIDMYLPAFPQMAEAFHATVARISLSISSYFIGLSLGQIFYGPLLDRFGRKKPTYFGLVLFILASVGCVISPSVEWLIGFRLLQALGGCVAQVGSIAMVRDFFHAREAAKIFSIMMLILGVSPLFAPTIGSLIAVGIGWQGIFFVLAGVVFLTLLAIYFFLPEGHEPDPTISLKPIPIVKEFIAIFKEPQFYTYALAGGFSFGGLFVYVAGSPIIFMNVFHVSVRVYGIIFAALSVGVIGGGQVNILLSRKFRMEDIFRTALLVQVATSLVFVVGALAGWWNLNETLALLFICLSCLGLTYPNAAAISLAPFSKNAGSASALLGFLQMGIGAIASASVGLFDSRSILPIALSLLGSSLVGAAVLFFGRSKIKVDIEVERDGTTVVIH